MDQTKSPFGQKLEGMATGIIEIEFFFFFFLHHAACRILVPQPGIEPMPSAVKVWSPHHWATREFPE